VAVDDALGVILFSLMLVATNGESAGAAMGDAFLIFFTLASAHFEPQAFVDHVGIIAVYFLAHIAGRVGGAAAGARLSGAPAMVVRWLGVGLVPQAGVAIGLALLLAQTPGFTAGGRTIVNIVLGTTVLYEVVGPLATCLALDRAGELRAQRPKRRKPA